MSYIEVLVGEWIRATNMLMRRVSSWYTEISRLGGGCLDMPVTAIEFLRAINARRTKLPGVQRCVECRIPLQETVTGNRPTVNGHVCSDCYFKMLGQEIDRFPVAMPRSTRGA